MGDSVKNEENVGHSLVYILISMTNSDIFRDRVIQRMLFERFSRENLLLSSHQIDFTPINAWKDTSSYGGSISYGQDCLGTLSTSYIRSALTDNIFKLDMMFPKIASSPSSTCSCFVPFAGTVGVRRRSNLASALMPLFGFAFHLGKMEADLQEGIY